MKPSYADIRSRIAEPPVWFDENGAPRYAPFAPSLLAPRASETALLRVACQCCGREFEVCMSWGGIQDGPRLSTLIPVSGLNYRDPPNVECCPAGPTMNSVPLRVLEFWRRPEFRSGGPDWERVLALEVEVVPDWAVDR